jgi:hypothetical protein
VISLDDLQERLDEALPGFVVVRAATNAIAVRLPDELPDGTDVVVRVSYMHQEIHVWRTPGAVERFPRSEEGAERAFAAALRETLDFVARRRRAYRKATSMLARLLTQQEPTAAG